MIKGKFLSLLVGSRLFAAEPNNIEKVPLLKSQEYKSQDYGSRRESQMGQLCISDEWLNSRKISYNKILGGYVFNDSVNLKSRSTVLQQLLELNEAWMKHNSSSNNKNKKISPIDLYKQLVITCFDKESDVRTAVKSYALNPHLNKQN